MKKVIVFTLFSLLGFGGFVAGLSGTGLAQPNSSQPLLAKEKDCTLKPHPKGKTKIKKVDQDFGKDVLAVLVLKADGSIEVMEGPGEINFTEPRKTKEGQPGAEMDVQPPAKSVLTEVPDVIQYDVRATPIISEIITYVGDTCMRVNGTYYCW